MKEDIQINSTLNIQLRNILLIAIVFVFALQLFTNTNTYTAAGLGITVYITLRLIVMIGHTIPAIEIMLFIAAVQWIVGPYLDYHIKASAYDMHMYVNEVEYMKITIPLYFVFALSSLTFRNKFPTNFQKIKLFLDKFNILPIYIIVLGLIFRLIDFITPPSFSFVSFLMINSSIAGIGLLYFTKKSWTMKYIWTGIALFPVFIHSIRTGMFHNLLIWCLFIFTFYGLAKKPSFVSKIAIISVSTLLLITLQLVKSNYRKTISSKSFNGNKTEVFFNLLVSEKTTKKLENSNDASNVNIRLNQGWIISRIYYRIPAKTDYLNGETIIDALASLMPRFLFPNKKKLGGGSVSFEELTGIKLSKGTAMGPSLMGEFYGNYGFAWSFLAFFIWGTLLSSIIKNINQFQRFIPILIFFIPFIFLQVIKAETDLTTVLNHLVKSLIVVTLYIVAIKKLFNVNYNSSD